MQYDQAIPLLVINLKYVKLLCSLQHYSQLEDTKSTLVSISRYMYTHYKDLEEKEILSFGTTQMNTEDAILIEISQA